MSECKQCGKLTTRRPYCGECAKYIYGRRSKHGDKIRARDREYQRLKRARLQHKTEESRQYRKKYPDKVKAQRILSRAVKIGQITKKPCEVCGDTNVHGHHPDYTKPLEVMWLCPIHHKAEHNK